MKAWLHSLGVALGFTTLALIWIPGPLNRDAFHWAGRPTALFVPIVVDFVVGWMLVAALLYGIRRPGRAHRFVWSTLLAFTPVLAVEGYALLPGNYVSPRFRLILGVTCLVLWVLLNTIFYRLFTRKADSVVRIASIVFLFLSLNGVYVLSHAVWVSWQARHLNPTPQAHVMMRAVPAGRPRIVWIVMDALSYKLVYGHRVHGLSLPAFDAFAMQATIFNNARPAADLTEFAIPDYIIGVPDTQNFYLSKGSLDIVRLDTGKRVAFDQYNTVFQDAHRSGYNTGITGWYIPYCRLLPEVADRCFWNYSKPNRNGMISTSSVATNILAPLRRLAAYVVPTRLATPWFTLEANDVLEREQHIKDYREILASADTMLRDRDLDFILLHIPVPHMPGIYDRELGALSADKPHGYIDNLALADHCLGHLRSVLESTGQWDNTTVLVMGDHSRRLAYEGSADVTASDVGFDPRPAYVVKLAGQHHAATINAPFDALRTRSLLQALLQQKIRTPEDLSSWVQHAP